MLAVLKLKTEADGSASKGFDYQAWWWFSLQDPRGEREIFRDAKQNT